MAQTSLVTAYGYAGDQALAITSRRSDSLNSTKMNMKMYAEVFRMLGWITPASRSKSYPVSFTLIGACAGNSSFDGASALAEQAIMGFVNPAETLQKVKYTESVRFFPLVLRSLRDLGDIMYKHELCLGPMSCDDNEESKYNSMIERIKALRGSHQNLTEAFADLCRELGMAQSSVDNSTRLPLGLLSGLGWIETGIRNKSLYGKTLTCFTITDKGKSRLDEYFEMADLRLDDYNALGADLKAPLVRMGAYSMLHRAGFDMDSVRDIRSADEEALRSLLDGRDLIFSPYQTLWPDTVNEALGYAPEYKDPEIVEKAGEEGPGHASSVAPSERTTVIDASVFTHSSHEDESGESPTLTALRNSITEAIQTSGSPLEAAETLFQSRVNDKLGDFYPLVADLFTLLGMPCKVSREGDNGARWDAIIIDAEESIPIEIKSPTEELNLSLKAVRQALENKVILLSRKMHPTLDETTSLAIGYGLPNARAEVSQLIDDIYETYDISIGAIGLLDLYRLAVVATIENSTINPLEMQRLKGFLYVDL